MVGRATIRDVARESGASIATVSRVLSGSDYPVSAPTRERIVQAAAALHYVPNEVGKRLKTQVSHDLGVIVPGIMNPYYAMLLQGVYDRALRAGYHIILCSAHSDAQEEAGQLRMLLQKRVDGILLASINPQIEAVQRAVMAGCPVVAMEQELPLACLQVGFDFERGAALATEYLVAHGHQHIGFLGAPLDRPSRRQMLAGFRTCMARHGLPVREEWVWLSPVPQAQAGAHEFAAGEACAQAFLAMDERPTGYVCLNDMTALGAMRTWQAAGLILPRDASVVGFDNILFSEISSPPLTTVDQHAYDMGDMAARLLIEQIEQPERLQPNVVLTPTLIERGSVCAPHA